MKNLILIISSFTILLFATSINPSKAYDTNENVPVLQTYIIQLRLPENVTITKHKDLKTWYRSFLPVTNESSSPSRMVHQYTDAIFGFAAKLSENEVKEMENKAGFLKAYPDRMLPLLTTHTPAFLGLQGANSFWKNSSNFGKGVIIGVLDTGIFPSHSSFNDEGMEPPRSTWKGKCTFKKPLGCNNKLIGARFMGRFGGYSPPIDEEGHGTHTASTAAGNFITNATVLGNGNGTAVGMAPRAHLSIYRVCGRFGCMTSDILAGMDAAIVDGVDIMSLSLGGNAHRYNEDVIAIGAFSAMEKGIFVSCAAGNSGPDSQTVGNAAPWILTVGASTMDRSIRVTVKLGDGQEIDGESVFQPNNFTSDMLPLVLPRKSATSLETNCNAAALGDNVKGKIVLCQKPLSGPRVKIGLTVKDAGGAAMILINDEKDGYTTLAEAHVLPASHISSNGGDKILTYFQSSSKPTASLLFKGTILGNSSAPSVASFSSRGPSIASPHIMKPDIIGPGVNVLAAWPFDIQASPEAPNNHNFNIISGTSMSTPHLSGIAALVKSVHPDWSPAAIKSAIMTTSDITCHDGNPITNELHEPASYFVMGAGHVNPEKAIDPGLVYDLSVEEYIGFLCGLGYDNDQVRVVTQHTVNCSHIKKISESELNYPSIAVSLKSGEITINRTVTHVSDTSAKYTVKMKMPEGVEISVMPETLNFLKMNEKKSFAVTLKRSHDGKNITEGELRWVSEKSVVRSPIVVTK